MVESTTESYCTTRHNCPKLEELLGFYKPFFLGYVPKTCNIDRRGYKMLFVIATRSERFLLWSNTIEEAAKEILDRLGHVQ